MSHPIIQWLFPNSSRVHLRKMNGDFASTVPSGSLVLDAGAGNAQYRDLFEHARYESADFEKVDKEYRPSTYVCDLASIPVEDERFDAIIFNQVMEHLPEPNDVLAELNRVLKPGGKLFCTAPLFYEEHEEPYDFYRYTQYAHRHMFDKAGFEIERMDWLEGYLGTLAYQMKGAIRWLPLKPSNISPGLLGYLLVPVMFVLRAIFTLSAMLFYRLDMRKPLTTVGHPKNYAVLARKVRAAKKPV